MVDDFRLGFEQIRLYSEYKLIEELSRWEIRSIVVKNQFNDVEN
jgi:hypothetical protein